MTKEIIGALVVGGSDSSAGAGIQGDLKTFNEIGVFAGTAITAITAQNTSSITKIISVGSDDVHEQIKQIDEEIDVKIIKTGALINSDIVKVVDRYVSAKNVPLILDPVIVATSGSVLLDNDAMQSVMLLSSKSYLLTPNIPELEILSNVKIKSEHDVFEAVKSINKKGVKNILVKGAHLFENQDKIISRLFTKDGGVKTFATQRIPCEFHGTGCTLASAISAYMIKQHNLESAINMALKFVDNKISKSKKGIKSNILI